MSFYFKYILQAVTLDTLNFEGKFRLKISIGSSYTFSSHGYDKVTS